MKKTGNYTLDSLSEAMHDQIAALKEHEKQRAVECVDELRKNKETHIYESAVDEVYRHLVDRRVINDGDAPPWHGSNE